MSADGTEQSSTSKHVAAFLGAPLGSAVLAFLAWVLLSEPYPLGPLTIQCIPMGAAQLGVDQVAMIATVVAALGALLIEVAS
ncbi:hypothetical protein GC722_05495 [Auraticoccus sp. F435]|uniref:Uncharacterized protein n=1 Tax=Auraticoccus cholistanensis TaxID=2656650 RepID=A0A6A9URT2_9ACTN|nr:hypothetical protein [Auraticoccus cholistanensis]MVA75483.1 hypothetical protein [Auraticoccus cholistanensis]